MAERVVAEFGGVFPKEVTALESLPGIGPYTARAICAFAHNQPVVLIEANIRRVYLHHFFTDVSEKISDQELLLIIQATLETKNPRHWYNLLMDYGTYLKKQGSVIHKKSTHYQKQKKFSGSIREARGKILKILIFGALSKKTLQQKTDLSKERFEVALLQLQKEGFLVEKHERFSLANT